jgi:hypothetical protein
MKKLKIGSFSTSACAGAPTPWNARSARVLGCGFGTMMDRDGADSIFHTSGGSSFAETAGLSGFPLTVCQDNSLGLRPSPFSKGDLSPGRLLLVMQPCFESPID